jgi:hypothetical protein
MIRLLIFITFFYTSLSRASDNEVYKRYLEFNSELYYVLSSGVYEYENDTDRCEVVVSDLYSSLFKHWYVNRLGFVYKINENIIKDTLIAINLYDNLISFHNILNLKRTLHFINASKDPLKLKGIKNLEKNYLIGTFDGHDIYLNVDEYDNLVNEFNQKIDLW